MAIATGTALLASAAIGAGASVLGASNAAKASQQAGDLQYRASQEAIAAQERMYNQTRQDNEPFRQIGLGAASALAGGLGLMTGGAGAGGGAAPQAGAPDWDAYLAAYPDVMAWAQSGHGDPNKPIEQQSLQERAAYHYRNSGQSENRALPTVQAAAPGTNTTPPGYTDPTAPGGYTMTARPEFGPAPTRQEMTPLDLSLSAFRVSPDYEFRVSEGNKALDRIAAANRGLMSGARLKAATRFNQNIADSEYTDWRAFTTGQYNTDRARQDALYSEGLSQYNRDRARSDGLYQDDRSRLDNRYDTRNSTLLSMAGFGTGANASNQSAAQSFAANQSNALMSGAQAQGAGVVGAANAWNQGINNMMTTGAYLWGNRNAGNYGYTGRGGGFDTLAGLY